MNPQAILEIIIFSISSATILSYFRVPAIKLWGVCNLLDASQMWHPADSRAQHRPKELLTKKKRRKRFLVHNFGCRICFFRKSFKDLWLNWLMRFYAFHVLFLLPTWFIPHHRMCQPVARFSLHYLPQHQHQHRVPSQVFQLPGAEWHVMTSFETDSLGTGRAEAGIPPPAVMPALAPALSGGVSNDWNGCFRRSRWIPLLVDFMYERLQLIFNWIHTGSWVAACMDEFIDIGLMNERTDGGTKRTRSTLLREALPLYPSRPPP